MADIPDRFPPSASAKPPPSKKISPHGIFELITFQVIRPGVGCVGKEAAEEML